MFCRLFAILVGNRDDGAEVIKICGLALTVLSDQDLVLEGWVQWRARLIGSWSGTRWTVYTGGWFLLACQAVLSWSGIGKVLSRDPLEWRKPLLCSAAKKISESDSWLRFRSDGRFSCGVFFITLCPFSGTVLKKTSGFDSWLKFRLSIGTSR